MIGCKQAPAVSDPAPRVRVYSPGLCASVGPSIGRTMSPLPNCRAKVSSSGRRRRHRIVPRVNAIPIPKPRNSFFSGKPRGACPGIAWGLELGSCCVVGVGLLDQVPPTLTCSCVMASSSSSSSSTLSTAYSVLRRRHSSIAVPVSVGQGRDQGRGRQCRASDGLSSAHWGLGYLEAEHFSLAGLGKSAVPSFDKTHP